MAEFTVENHGAIFILTPHTEAGRDWADTHIPDDAQTVGASIAVEHRYIADIVRGIQGDGLLVE